MTMVTLTNMATLITTGTGTGTEAQMRLSKVRI